MAGQGGTRRRSLFRAVAVGMAGLGLSAGIVFPGFVVLLGVPARIAFRPLFVASCLAAGLGVAAGNYTLVRLVIGRRLRLMAIGIARVQSGLAANAADQGRRHADQGRRHADLRGCRLDASTRDELGSSARAFNQLLDVLDESQRTRDQSAADVGGAVAVLQRAGERIGQAASAAAGEALSASLTADQVGSSVQEAARCADRIGGRLTETARQAGVLVDAAAQAAGTAAAARATSVSVAASTGEIVARMAAVEGITRQIRLLALNATIEATRAVGGGPARSGAPGGAGAGFRVVAAEIEALATRTAAVAGEITSRVADNHRLVTGLAEAMAGLERFTTGVSDNQQSVADELAGQVAAIRAIVRATTRAEQDANAIAEVISRAAEATGDTGVAAAEMQVAVADLARTAAQLTGTGGEPNNMELAAI